MTQTLPMTDLQIDHVDATGPASRRPSVLRRLALDSTYCFSAIALVPVAFVIVVAGLAAGAGLLVVWLGLPVLVGTVLAARGFAHVERGRLRSLQGRLAPSPSYVVPREGAHRVSRLLTPLRDPQSWLDALWGLVGFVTGLVAFVVTVTWWAITLGGLTYWFWQQWLPEDDVTLVELMGLGEGRTAESLLYLVFGVVALLTLPFVVRAAATVHAGVADVLLCSRAALQGEVRRVAGSREAAHLAEAESMRRLERDIHDGPQQRLVRLTMDLGRARKQLGDDPDRAVETLDAALLQARETVAELRSLSRGIAPPLLVDRGLRVALEEMAARSTVPVETRLDLPAALPPHVETAIYFVVAEALTNVAKHSGASRAAVTVTVTARRHDRGIDVRVEDDGIGGAHSSKGHGLAGLQQRLAGVDGRLDVHSPAGGPTVLTAQIPASNGVGEAAG